MSIQRTVRLKLALLGTVLLGIALAFTHAPAPPTQAQTPSPSPTPTCSGSPGQVNSTMYFQSKPQDGAQCGMSVRNGRIVVDGSVSNPNMSCPDMAAWKLYAEIIAQQFWKDWAADEETWPANPLPLCASGQDPLKNNCCDPNAKNNPGYDNKDYRAKMCPYFPGDHPDNPPDSFGQPPSKAHTVNVARRASGSQTLAAGEPGRDIRQSMAELVFRNKPMFDYVFRNNLYNQEGLMGVFKRNSDNISGASAGLPYHVRNGSGMGRDATPLVEFDFPIEAVMIKSNWVNAAYAQQNLGLSEDPNNPYIKMWVDNADTDNNGLIEGPGVYWLVAFHVSSKDTPSWSWATFEHVNNPGRCDYTGCNDSYGYSSPDPAVAGRANNYTTPKTKCDNLPIGSFVFDTGGLYGGGAVSPSLQNVLRELGIGTRPGAIPTEKAKLPSKSDSGWKSYRLKGAQTQFTDSMGNITRLGNSVTEGGFVNSSSCIACHARAGTASIGTLPPALGVFVNQVSEVGYGQSYNGTPDPDWYHLSRQPPGLTVLQTDFVWGFLFANCVSGSVPGCKPSTTLMSTPAPPAALHRGAAGSIRERIRIPVRPQ
jgi:hypothetical protein